jgi:hypothetical protein
MSYNPFLGPSDQYFAAQPADKAAAIILGKGESYFNILRSNHYLEKLQNMWRALTVSAL